LAVSGIPYIDWGVHPGRFWIRDQSYAGPYSSKKQIVSKARIRHTTANPRQSTNNYRLNALQIMLLLWLAECEVELGNLEKAREYVNLIQKKGR
jgi:hypothetical protein